MIIPALNPSHDLVSYVQSLVERELAQIVVVNDGSAPRCEATFAALAEVQRCVVLHHPENRGKGAALKTALRYCQANNPEGRWQRAIMVDADGQHAADDVCRLAAVSQEHPDSYALGIRDFNLDIVPARSRFGNRLTSGAFHLIYGRYLRDTQTGLRAVPAALWDWASSVPGERFEYETNCLIQAVKLGIPMVEMPIQTLYFDHNAGTHFKTLGDSWPIARTLLGNAGTYAASGTLSGVAAVLLFYAVDQVWLRSMAPVGRILLASLLASVVASLARLLFHLLLSVRTQRRASSATPKYYLLLTIQMLSAYVLVLGGHLAFRWPALLVKVPADFLLTLVGYQIHPRWLFRSGHGIG